MMAGAMVGNAFFCIVRAGIRVGDLAMTKLPGALKPTHNAPYDSSSRNRRSEILAHGPSAPIRVRLHSARESHEECALDNLRGRSYEQTLIKNRGFATHRAESDRRSCVKLTLPSQFYAPSLRS